MCPKEPNDAWNEQVSALFIGLTQPLMYIEWGGGPAKDFVEHKSVKDNFAASKSSPMPVKVIRVRGGKYKKFDALSGEWTNFV